ncbi:MAG: hypoxanthine phosphoribosyltransferase [Phycisphaeraceae bacterium]
MQGDIEKVLIDRETIARRVEEVAGRITADLVPPGAAGAAGVPDDGAELTIIPILTGSIIFVADLIRRLPVRMRIRLISVSSYPGESTSSRGATILDHLTSVPEDLSGQHVLVIDDILDSGRTLGAVTQMLRARGPAALRTCVLLRKQRPEALAFPIDYVCFDIPDAFVVGYGLDYNDYYRNLPDIVTLKPEVIRG